MGLRTLAVIAAGALLFAAPWCAFGEEEEEKDWELEIGGFFSAYWDTAEQAFILGPTEVEFEAELHPRFAATVSFEGECELGEGEGRAGLEVAFLDMYLQEVVEERDERPFVSNTGLTVGRYFVPFGVDHLVREDPDRWNISTPITADLMFDGGWTDVGAMLFTSISFADLKVYGVNGYTTSQPTVGGILDIIPVEWARFGGSYAMGSYEEENADWNRMGGHLKVAFGGAEISGEYVLGTDAEITVEEVPPYQVTVEPVDSTGYYGQLNFDFTDYFFPAYVGGRYGLWQPDYDANGDGDESNDDVTRITGYLGVRLIDPVTFKLEYQMNDFVEAPEGEEPPLPFDQEEEEGGFPEEVLWAGFVVSF